ncbi:MAG: proline--tRNA ligase [Nitrospinae bacterium]|nr:proline--tRNA ligase [Nitrospinota bacterium]MBF0633051.1 proline--tRNA ligase [Nitrospinota bacterium]
MRLTRFYIPTLKEAPAEADVASQKMMMRAGMIRKLAAGIYSTLPLGLRVIRKLENIIREEMNRAGAMEVFMPAVQPSELWVESGRWDVYGKELLRFRDRHDREFCFGPTHEEVITDLVRRDVRSYRDLPLNFYQIQTKFRDEIRPRFGVMRGREFSMKDAYSFDATDDGANKSYEAMRVAYTAIFTRLGLNFRAVEADTGQIGGSFSHEFMVLADSGEDTIAYCGKCEYAANVEKVEIKAPADVESGEALPLEEVSTPKMKTIEEVSGFLKIAPERLIKTLVYKTDTGEFVVALTRGDHDVNNVKLARAVKANEVTMADDAEVFKATNAPSGFLGPIGLTSVKIIADNAVRVLRNAVTGANKKDAHVRNVNHERDFPNATFADIRNVKAGDPCPRCAGGVMGLARGIEVGHIFKLGTKYSEAMRATFLDSEGKEQPMIMGCYGIGVGRTAAAAIEQNHDDKGIIWPSSIAPFDVAVIPLNMDDEAVVKAAEEVYAELMKEGLDPIIDDRDARGGVKFNDADLVGYPAQVVVGKKSLAEGKVEIKNRKTGERVSVAPGEVVAEVRKVIAGY